MIDSIDSTESSERLTQAEYARRRRVSRQRINQLVKTGKIPLHGNRIDPVEADRAIAASAHGSYDHNRKMLPLTVPSANMTRPVDAALDGATGATPGATSARFGEASLIDELKTDEQGVDEIYQHLKKIIFNGRDMRDVPHVEIKKLNEFIGAVQRKREMEEHARRLIPVQEAQNHFVQVAGQVREGLLNLANRIAGATSAKALELLRNGLPPEHHAMFEALMQGKQWEDLFHQTIHQETTEVLRALSADMLRQP